MKKVKMIMLIFFIILSFTLIIEGEERVVFEITDPVGDEYGPGTYTYPKSEQFQPYEGLFDLIYFKVDEVGDHYNFYFKFNQLTNPWHAKYGFSHQLIQVYISNDGEGSIETFRSGANILLEEKHPWQKLIKVTGWSLELINSNDQLETDNRIKEDRIEVLEDKKTIKVSIAKSSLGDLEKAQYYVLVGALDGFAYDNFREVVKDSEGWKFGGGSDTDFDPNIIDTLVPVGMDQKKVLGSFDLEEGKFATLRAVGPELGLHWKFTIIFGFLFIMLAVILGTGLKYLFKTINKYNQ